MVDRKVAIRELSKEMAMVHILFGVLATTVYTFFKTLSVHLRSVHFTILIHKDSGEFPKWASGERQVPSLTS